MLLFDSHGHIASEQYGEDRAEVLSRMAEAGVRYALIAADPTEGMDTAMELTANNEHLFLAAGVHPHNASGYNEDCERAILAASENRGFVCVGEIGLDYHYDLSPRDVQRDVFDRQLELAFERGWPVQLHIREAHGDCMDMLRARAAAGRMPDAIMHCYTGSWESAKVYLSLGMYISLSGAVTFKNAPKLREVAEMMPLDRLLVETDCPYMAPVPLRGRRNEPAFVKYTAQRIAEIRCMDVEELARITTENALRAFRIAK